MISEIQLAANRNNALVSTGPSTPAGKSTVAKNAVTHGIWSNLGAIPGLEKQEEWEEYLKETVASWSPIRRNGRRPGPLRAKGDGQVRRKVPAPPDGAAGCDGGQAPAI